MCTQHEANKHLTGTAGVPLIRPVIRLINKIKSEYLSWRKVAMTQRALISFLKVVILLLW